MKNKHTELPFESSPESVDRAISTRDKISAMCHEFSIRMDIIMADKIGEKGDSWKNMRRSELHELAEQHLFAAFGFESDREAQDKHAIHAANYLMLMINVKEQK